MLRFLLLFFLFIPVLLNAANPIIHNTPAGVEFRNDHTSIILSSNAELVSCKDLEIDIDIAEKSNKKVASIRTVGGVLLEARNLNLLGDVLEVTIGQYVIHLKVQAFKDFFTVEVLNTSLPGVEELMFLDLKLTYDFTKSNAFVAADVAMTLQTDPVYFPSGENKAIKGRCTAQTGFKGAKIAFVVCQKSKLRLCLQKIYATIPSGTVPFTFAGGAFALDSEINKNDCVIISGNSEINDIRDMIKFYSDIGIKQFEFHKGPKSFISGQFSFPKYGSAMTFKEKVTEPLREAGIVSILHTYSYYIDYEAWELLSNPKWQQQLEFKEIFTLSKALSESSKQIFVREDASGLYKDATYWSLHTPYLLVDDEIIKYTLNQKGFAFCERGMCGTVAARHNTGAKVRIIGGKYSCIAPQIGSGLYYEVARRTAKAYNEGGFGGIYFDAYDGLGTHLKNAGKDGFLWYYGATFINEVLKYCKGTPIVEYSNHHPTVWAARGRSGAWDFPVRGYKNFIDDHMIYNKDFMARHNVTTLGWYNFYPIQKGEPGNYATKYMFSDDVDYIGEKTIAYDQPMVYNGLKESDLESIPAMRRNLESFCRYSKLRAENYFSDEVKTILREGKYEYKLDRKRGAWGFYEACYCRNKLRDIMTNQVIGNNPFKRQKPFVRLENMYSSDFGSSVPLITFNENVSVGKQKCENHFDVPLNLSNHLGLKVSIKGNGLESRDAICIRLSSVFNGSTIGVGDYVVRLNFEGWRDVFLTSLDNAEFSDLKFKGMEDPLYKVHRYNVDFSRINSLCLFFSGECKGIRIRSIEAVPLTPNPLLNPCIHLSNASITFKDTIQSGEYIEYQAGDKTAEVYDSIGYARTISVERRGQFKVPSGQFTAKVTGTADIKNTPSEVVLTFGLYGKFIHN